ncbi:hypothetical protein Tco_1219652, partial [Tanacetum coccineum]
VLNDRKLKGDMYKKSELYSRFPECQGFQSFFLPYNDDVPVVTEVLFRQLFKTLLDDNVSQNVELELEMGGIPLIVQLTARNFRFECGLVYVSEPGYMLFRDGVPQTATI